MSASERAIESFYSDGAWLCVSAGLIYGKSDFPFPPQDANGGDCSCRGGED